MYILHTGVGVITHFLLLKQLNDIVNENNPYFFDNYDSSVIGSAPERGDFQIKESRLPNSLCFQTAVLKRCAFFIGTTKNGLKSSEKIILF
jgi:hypothetical protein